MTPKPSTPVLIWDWNGTLLDDLQVTMQCINELLEEYDLPSLTITRYRQIFQFPVKNYYELAGFDFAEAPFEILAQKFISNYYRHLPEISLYPGVESILKWFDERGYTQYILSAMENNTLNQNVKKLGIAGYFKKIYGLNHIYASGKLDLGHHLVQTEGMTNGNTWMMGDTAHDAEISSQLQFNFVFVPWGHQDLSVIQPPPVHRIKTLSDLISIL
ncbi:MAG: HAD family hydrolase [Promethearchaeota archaeon]